MLRKSGNYFPRKFFFQAKQKVIPSNEREGKNSDFSLLHLTTKISFIPSILLVAQKFPAFLVRFLQQILSIQQHNAELFQQFFSSTLCWNVIETQLEENFLTIFTILMINGCSLSLSLSANVKLVVAKARHNAENEVD